MLHAITPPKYQPQFSQTTIGQYIGGEKTSLEILTETLSKNFY